MADANLKGGAAATLVAIVIVVGAIAFFTFKPWFQIAPEEEGLILRLGAYDRTVHSGLHFKFPWPIESLVRSPVKQLQQLEIGFRTIDQGPPARYLDYRNDARMLAEAQMLTGDENIVNADMTVQWKISNSEQFFFNYKHPEKTLRDISESALRQVIGDHSIDAVLTTGKLEIQMEIKAIVQELANKFSMGVKIDQILLGEIQPPQQVAQAFKDVATAKEDKARMINEAKGYAKEKEPAARGKAAEITQESEGYAAHRIAIAVGDAQRFTALADEYRKARDVTRARLYYEAMQEILSKVTKIIVDADAPILNLNNLAQ
jgi:modulator of FtsH protease HflK